VREGGLDEIKSIPENDFGREFIEGLLLRERLLLEGALSDPAWSSERPGYELLLVCPDERV